MRKYVVTLNRLGGRESQTYRLNVNRLLEPGDLLELPGGLRAIVTSVVAEPNTQEAAVVVAEEISRGPRFLVCV
jgi:hypothetical protein